MAIRNKKIIEDLMRDTDYVYGKGVPQTNEDRWKRESQYPTHNVNDDYTQKAIDAAERGDFPGASLYERISNEKYKLGYGTKKAPTYMFNYNPSENQKKAEDVREKLAMYDKFDYDPSEDAAYKALTNVYHNNAKAASENALAKAAAANGGRLSSNAIIAANLGYQDKMAGLEAEIPQLRQAANNMFRDEKNDLRQLGYDYPNAEDVNYNRWVDNYNRMYTGTMDRLSIDRTNKLDEQSAKVQELNTAMVMAQNLGYVTSALSALTGVPEGTPFASVQQYLTNLQMSVQSDMGNYSREWLDSQGMPYVEAGPTLASKQLDATINNNLLDYTASIYKTDKSNEQYNPYADQDNNVDDNSSESSDDTVAEPTSEQKINDALAMVQGSANPVDELKKLMDKGKLKLTDSELTILYSKIG